MGLALMHRTSNKRENVRLPTSLIWSTNDGGRSGRNPWQAMRFGAMLGMTSSKTGAKCQLAPKKKELHLQ